MHKIDTLGLTQICEVLNRARDATAYKNTPQSLEHIIEDRRHVDRLLKEAHEGLSFIINDLGGHDA